MQGCRFSVFSVFSFATANNYQMVIFSWDHSPCTPYIYLRLYGIFKPPGLPAAIFVSHVFTIRLTQKFSRLVIPLIDISQPAREPAHSIGCDPLI